MKQENPLAAEEHVSASLPVAISKSAWGAVVAFPQEPARETERLYQLMQQAFQAWSTARPGATQVPFGLYCEPVDGNVRAPLWQALTLSRETDQLLISLSLS